jgi:hypothetical protein
MMDLPCDMKYLRLRAVECGNCLEWNRAMVHGRYPAVTFRVASDAGRRKVQRQFYVRHLVYEITHGEPPPDDPALVISTSCDNDRCIAPKHVVIRSKQELSELAAARGLYRTAAFRARVASGRAHHRKLSDEGVDELRTSDAPTTQLARKHGISREHARRVRIGIERVDHTNPFAALQASAS